jgi:rhamnogalacturonyl hydrolase YesR
VGRRGWARGGSWVWVAVGRVFGSLPQPNFFFGFFFLNFPDLLDF